MIIPATTPRLSREALSERLARAGHVIDRRVHPVIVVGIRGYYLDTMGNAGVNDRGIFDDAIFLDSPTATVAYNGNTDPSRVRVGTPALQGMAVLDPGLYYAHRFDLHKGEYLALCQRNGPVNVTRDGGKKERGYFGINIHRAGETVTSSEGCQTVPFSQWSGFRSLAISEAKRYFGDEWKRRTIPYALLEEVRS